MFLVPAVVWTVLAGQFWTIRRRSPLRFVATLYFVPTSLVALISAIGVLMQLVPAHLEGERNTLRTVVILINDLSLVALLPAFRHASLYASFRGEPPGRGWLAVNYGAGAVMGLVVLVAEGHGIASHGLRVLVAALMVAYMVGMLALAARGLARDARNSTWHAGGLGEPHRLDAVMIGLGVVGALGALAVAAAHRTAPDALLRSGPPHLALWVAGLDSVALLAFAVPPAVRMLGTVIERLLMATAAVAVTAAIYAGWHAVATRVTDAEVRRLVALAAMLALIGLLGPGRTRLQTELYRVVLRVTRPRHAELQAFLHTLAPDLGIVECCRLALAELARVMQLRGAAILLHTGETVVHGEFDVEPLARVWPRGAAMHTLPTHAFVGEELAGKPALIEALIAADAIGVLPIVSPRQRSGDLFVRTGLFRATLLVAFQDEDVLEAFVGQLALVLDAAALLARAVAVERSLAHAEKLAAIGELTARVAHEIRNPVTAARSLAQQLARAPASGDAEAAGLILTELERVERQVAALLRFAHREEFRFEAVDMGALVRATVAQLGPRLRAAGVAVELDAPDAVGARADREKIRQVLINLIENAIDALAANQNGRRLRFDVQAADGACAVRVADNGPGVAADALLHLFEPFFTLKEAGTGLGLAIAKRTIEAHGGQITARSRPGDGTTFEIRLPLARTA